MLNRSYTPRTTRNLAEYLAGAFPNATRISGLHLTKANPAAIAAAGGDVSPRFGSTPLGWIDGVVVTPGEVALWESGDILTTAKIGQLEGYAHLWPQSVEAELYPNREVTLHMLVARDNPTLHALAASKGIEVVVRNPPWYQASQQSVAANAESARVVALSKPILLNAATGRITSDEAVTQLVALGVSRDSAEQQVIVALQQAHQAGVPA